MTRARITALVAAVSLAAPAASLAAVRPDAAPQAHGRHVTVICGTYRPVIAFTWADGKLKAVVAYDVLHRAPCKHRQT